jgi:hypothetical protein
VAVQEAIEGSFDLERDFAALVGFPKCRHLFAPFTAGFAFSPAASMPAMAQISSLSEVSPETPMAPSSVVPPESARRRAHRHRPALCQRVHGAVKWHAPARAETAVECTRAVLTSPARLD